VEGRCAEQLMEDTFILNFVFARFVWGRAGAERGREGLGRADSVDLRRGGAESGAGPSRARPGRSRAAEPGRTRAGPHVSFWMII
jgi:hypothetical protein